MAVKRELASHEFDASGFPAFEVCVQYSGPPRPGHVASWAATCPDLLGYVGHDLTPEGAVTKLREIFRQAPVICVVKLGRPKTRDTLRKAWCAFREAGGSDATSEAIKYCAGRHGVSPNEVFFVQNSLRYLVKFRSKGKAVDLTDRNIEILINSELGEIENGQRDMFTQSLRAGHEIADYLKERGMSAGMG